MLVPINIIFEGGFFWVSLKGNEWDTSNLKVTVPCVEKNNTTAMNC